MEFKKREIDYKNELMEMGDVIRFADNPRIKDETLAMHITRMMMFASGFVQYVFTKGSDRPFIYKDLLAEIFAHDIEELKLGDVSYNIKSELNGISEAYGRSDAVNYVSEKSIKDTGNKAAMFAMTVKEEGGDDYQTWRKLIKGVVSYLDVYDSFYVFYKKDFENKYVLERCYNDLISTTISIDLQDDVVVASKLNEITEALQEGRFILNE